jgi:hypothetical protein
MALSTMTVNIKTPSIIILSIMYLIATLSMMTLSIIGTKSNDTQHNVPNCDTQPDDNQHIWH